MLAGVAAARVEAKLASTVLPPTGGSAVAFEAAVALFQHAAHIEVMTTKMTTLLTQDQLADYLQIPVRTIEGWRFRQYGPRALRMGKHVRYRESDVQAWIDEEAVA
jgi:excisionase family DNA binding protein